MCPEDSDVVAVVVAIVVSVCVVGFAITARQANNVKCFKASKLPTMFWQSLDPVSPPAWNRRTVGDGRTSIAGRVLGGSS
jgi:hypothetical protein